MIKNFFILITATLVSCSYTDKKFEIEGTWGYYTSIRDMTNPNNKKLKYLFDNSKMSTIMVSDYPVPPVAERIDDYKIEKDTLKTFSKTGTGTVVIFVVNNNLISLTDPADKRNKFYLRRVVEK